MRPQNAIAFVYKEIDPESGRLLLRDDTFIIDDQVADHAEPIDILVPEKPDRAFIQDTVFQELCLGIAKPGTRITVDGCLGMITSHTRGV